MRQSWSELVSSQEWRQRAEQWIGDVLHIRGRTVSGPIEQPRIRPWSTQLMVPTDQGTVWFKANCPSMVFEPGLQRALHGLIPDDVDDPLAIDAGRGWMLTIDRGTSLGESHEPTSQDWQHVLSLTARIQRVLAPDREALTEAGLPDFSPGRVPDRFDRLVERFVHLPVEHPSHVSAELAKVFDEARPRLVDAAVQLEESPLPSTFQHADVHPWNVFVGDDRGMRIFDFGDAQWAFALEALAVPYGWITGQALLRWEPIRDSYLDIWSDLVSPREFEALWQASTMTHAVNRAVTWWGGLQGANESEWTQWGDAPLAHLRNVLESPG